MVRSLTFPTFTKLWFIRTVTMDLIWSRLWRWGLGAFHSRQGPVMGSCEHITNVCVVWKARNLTSLAAASFHTPWSYWAPQMWIQKGFKNSTPDSASWVAYQKGLCFMVLLEFVSQEEMTERKASWKLKARWASLKPLIFSTGIQCLTRLPGPLF